MSSKLTSEYQDYNNDDKNFIVVVIVTICAVFGTVMYLANHL